MTMPRYLTRTGVKLTSKTPAVTIKSAGQVKKRKSVSNHNPFKMPVTPEERLQQVIDKEVKIRAGTYIGYDLEANVRRGCTISEKGVVVVPRGMDIGPI